MRFVFSTNRERWREGIGQSDQRALIEESPDVAGVGRFRIESGIAEPRVILEGLGVAFEALGSGRELLGRCIARDQSLDHEPHSGRQSSLLGPHLGLAELGGVPMRLDLERRIRCHGLVALMCRVCQIPSSHSASPFFRRLLPCSGNCQFLLCGGDLDGGA